MTLIKIMKLAWLKTDRMFTTLHTSALAQTRNRLVWAKDRNQWWHGNCHPSNLLQLLPWPGFGNVRYCLFFQSNHILCHSTLVLVLDTCHLSKWDIDSHLFSNSLRGHVLVFAWDGICLSVCIKLLPATAGRTANPSFKPWVLARQLKDLAYGLNEWLSTAGGGDTVVLMQRVNHKLGVYSVWSQDLCGRSECSVEAR